MKRGCVKVKMNKDFLFLGYSALSSAGFACGSAAIGQCRTVGAGAVDFAPAIFADTPLGYVAA
jgi:hypothetical protein